MHDAPGGHGSSWWDTAKDVAQSAATGIEKGALGMATALPAVERFARETFNSGLNRLLPAPPKPVTDAPPEVSKCRTISASRVRSAVLLPWASSSTSRRPGRASTGHGLASHSDVPLGPVSACS